jgi:HAD superfamily hydrolase (TIGR01509 family)
MTTTPSAASNHVTFIFWDNDGILVDTEKLYFEATKNTLLSIGISFGESEYRQLFLQEGRGAWHLAREIGMTEEQTRELKRKRNQAFSDLLLEKNVLMPNVRTTLESLTPSRRHAIVTSSRKEHFDLIHRNTMLLPYFEFVLTREDYRLSKPDPEPYLKALERSGVPTSQCLVIEDSERGLRSAKGAGLNCWVIPTPLTRESRFQEADRILNDITEIPELLRNQTLT